MNKQICFIIFLLTCRICDAQNLVPNGDFEQYSGCPTGFSQIDSALFWTKPASGTSDYFNQCSASTAVGVPDNFVGYQQAYSGSGYSGIYLYSQPPLNVQYREYIEVPLTSALSANVCYHFEMYVNLGNKCVYSTDDIGIYFSNALISGIFNWNPLPFTPQIISTAGFISDTLNWTLVSGNYTASGGEAYIIIGNFKNDAMTDTITLLGSLTGNISATYIYIDDVSLTACTGVEEQSESAEIEIYPNPFNEKLTVSMKNNKLSEIFLYDIASRKLIQQQFTNSVTLSTEQLAKGIYLYEVRNNPDGSGGVIKKGKVVKD